MIPSAGTSPNSPRTGFTTTSRGYPSGYPWEFTQQLPNGQEVLLGMPNLGLWTAYSTQVWNGHSGATFSRQPIDPEISWWYRGSKMLVEQTGTISMEIPRFLEDFCPVNREVFSSGFLPPLPGFENRSSRSGAVEYHDPVVDSKADLQLAYDAVMNYAGTEKGISVGAVRQFFTQAAWWGERGRHHPDGRIGGSLIRRVRVACPRTAYTRQGFVWGYGFFFGVAGSGKICGRLLSDSQISLATKIMSPAQRVWLHKLLAWTAQQGEGAQRFSWFGFWTKDLPTPNALFKPDAEDPDSPLSQEYPPYSTSN
jgi:hypothetical protein